MKNRLQTRKVKVGPCEIGGSDHVYIQSMTNTPTKDVQATVQQIHNLEKAGCEIVRVACLDMTDAKAIKDIKSEIHIPLVADIHFDYRLALQAIASGVDKVRINPGNIGSKEKVKAVVSACQEKGIPIRIGVNGGSLEKPLLEKYGGVTPEAMVESARNHVRILEELDFHDIIISLKASDPLMCVKAYELAAETFDYPLHIGITEAGTAFGGTIRSAVGLGILLHEGIGNTMRVSLSDDPVEEIRVAREILKNFHLIKDEANLISCPTCGRTQYDMIPIAKNIEAFLKDIHEPLTVAVMGCVVNGPGEARQADVGIAGGNKEGILFKKGQVVKTVPHEKMESELKKAILEMVKRP